MAEGLSFEQSLSDERRVNCDAERRKRKIRRVIENILAYALATQSVMAVGAGLKEKNKLPPLPAVLEKFLDISEKEIEFIEKTSDPDGFFLRCYLGKEKIAELEQNWRTARTEDNETMANRQSGETAFSNPDQINIDPEWFKTFSVSTFPDNWVNGEVDSVIFRDEAKEMPDRYGIDGEAAAIATTKRSGTTKVNFYRGAGTDFGDVEEIFAHETGHANDWENDEQLSFRERKRFLVEVAKRFFTGENTVPFSYVEAIKNDDQNEENYLKIKEYWAEICEEYFSNPDYFAARYPDDYRLVHRWITKDYQDFDPVIAKMKRNFLRWYFTDNGQISANWEGEFTELLNRSREGVEAGSHHSLIYEFELQYKNSVSGTNQKE